MHRPIAILLTSAAVLFLFAFTSTRTSVPWHSAILPYAPGSRPDLYLDARLAHAERLWQQAVEDRKEMVAQSGDRQFPDGYIYPYHVWDFARPSFFCPHDLERVGTLGDGGKVVCGMSRYEAASPGPSAATNPAPELVIYSFGVNDDSSFEAAMLERTNAQIWGYDYTVNGWAKQIPAHQASRAHFTKAGIGKDRMKDPPFFTVHELMEINGHDYIDIVKMDIEGAEFDAISDLVSSVRYDPANRYNGTLPFGQLLVEIHLVDGGESFSTPKDLAAFMNWWHSMEELGLRPVNNEDNWIGNNILGKPRFMEYTMISVLDKKKNKLL
ncbi:hypothetical protein N657DRAFT_690743 [Parathielavia appendiculata]|uniref:Methyltransferase domain-containing protein n=1 Tax=Parathielavia appendiculata TaxID=2587402 RepID=A0AAN6TYF2_9PEZI|nr:hypothetical protein N657DRAFT_690743 [Parathielavia appendiculata]